MDYLCYLDISENRINSNDELHKANPNNIQWIEIIFIKNFASACKPAPPDVSEPAIVMTFVG
jgi:hypothetical protein